MQDEDIESLPTLRCVNCDHDSWRVVMWLGHPHVICEHCDRAGRLLYDGTVVAVPYEFRVE